MPEGICLDSFLDKNCPQQCIVQLNLGVLVELRQVLLLLIINLASMDNDGDHASKSLRHITVIFHRFERDGGLVDEVRDELHLLGLISAKKFIDSSFASCFIDCVLLLLLLVSLHRVEPSRKARHGVGRNGTVGAVVQDTPAVLRAVRFIQKLAATVARRTVHGTVRRTETSRETPEGLDAGTGKANPPTQLL